MRTKTRAVWVIALIALLIAPTAQASDDLDVDLGVVDHAADGVYLDFKPFANVELPRLFLMRDADGDLTFAAYGSTASALESGRFNASVEREDGDVDMLSAEPELATLVDAGDHIYAGLQAREGSIVLDLSITRHLVYGILGGLITLLIFITLARRYARGVGRKEAPRGVFQNMFELMVIYIRDEVAKPTLGDKHEKFLPYLLTAFFFILFCNLLGLVPYGGSATGNIAVTGILAVFTFLIGQIYATKEHWKHLFFGPSEVPWFVRPILVPVEILGLLTRHAALAIRLFANMMAGALVITAFIGIIFIFNALFGWVWASVAAAPASVILTIFISLIKLLVSFIQAYVFTILSALFIGMAVEEHGDHEHDEHEPAEELAETREVASDGRPGDGQVEMPAQEHEPVPTS